jgi:hypothetical protein
LGLALDAKDEGKGRTYMAPEPDNADSALHPVVEKIIAVPNGNSSGNDGPVFVDIGTPVPAQSEHRLLHHVAANSVGFINHSSVSLRESLETPAPAALAFDQNTATSSAQSPDTDANYLLRHCKLCAKEVGQINRLFALSKRISHAKKRREGLNKSLNRKSHGPLSTKEQINRILDDLTGSVSPETLNSNSVSNNLTVLKVTEMLSKQAIDNLSCEIDTLAHRIDRAHEDILLRLSRLEEDELLQQSCLFSLRESFDKTWNFRREIDFQLRKGSKEQKRKLDSRDRDQSLTPASIRFRANTDVVSAKKKNNVSVDSGLATPDAENSPSTSGIKSCQQIVRCSTVVREVPNSAQSPPPSMVQAMTNSSKTQWDCIKEAMAFYERSSSAIAQNKPL